MAKPVDFRKRHDGLAALAERELSLDPHSDVIIVLRAKRGADQGLAMEQVWLSAFRLQLR